MKLFCLFLGHEWLTPTWESYELWEHCARCVTKRRVVSVDSFFTHLGIRFLIALPAAISVSLLEDKLLKQRDSAFADAWLTELGLYGDHAPKEIVPPETVPEAWLPWIRFALAELVQSTKLDADRIENFFSSFVRESALPLLFDMANSGFCLLGEPIEEKVIATKELSLERRKQFMYGNWQDAAECAEVIVDIYKVETLHAHYQPTRPIASGAQKALRILRDKKPTLQLAIDPELFFTDPLLPVQQEFTRSVWVKSIENRTAVHC